MSYSTACAAEESGRLKGTGRKGNSQAGAVTEIFWATSDQKFASKDAATDIDNWNSEVEAGKLHYIGKIAEMDSNDAEATFYESAIGNLRLKTAESKRIRQYRLVECACTHAALLSFDGQNGRLYLRTDRAFVKATIDRDGIVKGFKTSQFDVGMLVEATPETPAFTPIDVTFENAKNDDINVFEDTIDFTFDEVDQVFNAEFIENTVASNGTNLTFNLVGKKGCSDVPLIGAVTSDFKVTDSNGSQITTFTVSETAGTYAFDVTTAETVVYVDINGVKRIAGTLYLSDEIKVSVA